MQNYNLKLKIKVTAVFLTFFFAILGLADNSYAATYYASNTNCSDSNPGTEASPWCHSPGIPSWTGSATLSAGDTVYFDRGGTWTETSGNFVLNITGGVAYIGDTWGSGTRAKLVAGANMGYGSVIWFGDDDATYETVLQGFEVDAGGANATASCPRTGGHYANNGISFNYRGRGSGAYATLTGKTKRIDNSIVHDTWSCTDSSEYFYGLLVGSQSGYITENVEILNTTVYNQSRSAITIYPSTASNNWVRNVLIRGSETYSTAQEPGYSAGLGVVLKNQIENAIVEFNYLHGNNDSTGAAFYVSSDVSGGGGATGIILRYNILESTTNGNIIFGGYGPKQIDVYGNIIMNLGTNSGIGISFFNNISGNLDVKMYNNILYRNQVLIRANSANNNLEFKNNIVYETGRIPLEDQGGYIGSAHNNNIYYRTDGGTLVSSGVASYTSSNLTSYESTALSTNPLFINTSSLPTGFTGTYGIDMAPNTDGLSLQSNSPAIDQGADLGITYNGSINTAARPQGSYWDRGAYEYCASGNCTSSGGGGGGSDGGSTGGDSSAAGGSGCGFVKDDGKGQGAKGEGVALMIMLIISLTGIALLKKLSIK